MTKTPTLKTETKTKALSLKTKTMAKTFFAVELNYNVNLQPTACLGYGLPCSGLNCLCEDPFLLLHCQNFMKCCYDVHVQEGSSQEASKWQSETNF